jgi:hypothetical protein|tara:strand:+ start:1 stop:855 length:855 start_codon:yes stop_codon:yes gene_type:complete
MSEKLTDKELKAKLIQQNEITEVKENKFPTEIIDLPSKGLLYPKSNPLSSGKIEMKYMTAKEEDILASQALIQKGIVLDKLFQALIISNGEGEAINYGDILTGDKDAVMIAARVLGYGKDYGVVVSDPSDSSNEQDCMVDLTLIENKEIDESDIQEVNSNKFNFTLPISKKVIEFKLPTHSTENKIEKELKVKAKVAGADKSIDRTLSTRMKHMILSIDGEDDRNKISNFVNNQFLAQDSRKFREYVEKIMPGVKLEFLFESSTTGEEAVVGIPINLQFFWPGA